MRLSARLRSQLDDIQEHYDAAKMNEDAGRMEKLSGAIQKLAKEVKMHEEYERETLPAREVRRLISIIGVTIGKYIKQHVEHPEIADLIIEGFHEEMQEIVDSLGGD